MNAQAPVPLHPVAEPLPPLQPLKAEPALGEAVRLTAVLCAKLTLQVSLLLPFHEQFKPLPVTLPLPVPDGVTVKTRRIGHCPALPAL